jgi:hypothetical protein
LGQMTNAKAHRLFDGGPRRVGVAVPYVSDHPTSGLPFARPDMTSKLGRTP